MTVALLLATYNGAAFLQDQLHSFTAQTHQDWALFASDDGSTDATYNILNAFSKAQPDHHVYHQQGPCAGFATNFLQLLEQVPDSCSFAAFSDQDDVWMPDKLTRATRVLAPFSSTPTAYCSNRIICNSSLASQVTGPIAKHPPSFANALVQNMASGNTLVLNRAAIDVLRPLISRLPDVPFHDWWVYQMLTGMGHLMIYDPTPSVFYRQHGGNKIGAGMGLRQRIARTASVLRGHHKHLHRNQLAALYSCQDKLTKQHRQILEEILNAQKTGRIAQIKSAYAHRLKRQTKLGTASFYAALVFGAL